ncbi:SAF domain-containing protein [Nakamurella endophytica]|uniref:SAF domain-containing protein n=1 Tax=Nakamurella endophytica TaxID=1748367 RepID=A0A917SN70_9ACTN|nr:SAF domain-containing protein [Nakamurella endophytica]GGL88901.1 hypothetical protein GCM10011594_05710 [Nakamurella endophytica]
MKSRLLAAAVALVLAAAGTVVLVSYLRGVDVRAAQAARAAAPRTVAVLVAARPIPAGAPAAAVAAAVTSVELPESAVLPDRITDPAQLAGRVALVPLAAGEQLLLAKFGTPPPATTAATPTVSVSPSFQQVTVLLPAERALGGRVAPGQTVGIFISLKSGQTHLAVQKVLVTAVQKNAAPAPATGTTASTTPQPGDAAAGADAAATGTSTAAPAGTVAPVAADAAAVAADAAAATTTSTGTGTPAVDPTVALLVTFALSTPDSEKVVFAAEHGSIWLSDDPATADENGTRIVDGQKVYR